VSVCATKVRVCTQKKGDGMEKCAAEEAKKRKTTASRGGFVTCDRVNVGKRQG
jgi:hypothetical protein